ncbi:MAG: hypothetical protein PPP58_09255 [Natronomonas sp.]
MRKYPATLVRVFENKLEAGADTTEPIRFDKADLEAATDQLDIEVREVMEIASAYASTRGLPEEITDHGYVDIAPVEGDDKTYQFVRE